MSRRGTVRKKRRGPVEQHTPSFQRLIEKYNSGLTSRREITYRVNAGLPNKVNQETKNAYEALKAIAINEGWVTA